MELSLSSQNKCSTSNKNSTRTTIKVDNIMVVLPVNPTKKTLTIKTVNPLILTFKAMEYLARGPVILRALEIQRDLTLGGGVKKPYAEISFLNLGDAHAMGQKPITFVRQVLALVSHPELINESKFPRDAQQRAKTILQSCRGGSIGSYSDSKGIELIRKDVSEYIHRRDGGGITSKVDDVILCAGASDGIRAVLKLLKNGPNTQQTGILTPIPGSPLYNATLGEYNMKQIGYYLDEVEGWAVNINELQRVTTDARNNNYHPRAIVVINPGNTTGHVLTEKNIQDIIKFAFRERLIILADEVYQDNVHGGTQFHSFKKVMMKMDAPYNTIELVSFYSCSKGFICECGLRGGYCEVVNIDEAVKSVLFESIAAKSCSPVLGQIALDCIMDPPKLGEPSYEHFQYEKCNILNSLTERGRMIEYTFNSLPGLKCSSIRGAMYAFPQVILPAQAIKEASVRGLEPDVFYCLQLLEATGISVVPGSGIGQYPGTYHFRTTVLPSREKLKILLEKFKEFHLQFINTYTNTVNDRIERGCCI